MTNGAASLVYLLMLLLALIPTSIYCHYKDKESENNNEH